MSRSTPSPTPTKKKVDPFASLRPFGDRYLAFREQMADCLGSLSLTELADLDRAAHSVSTTNIGWTHYEAAKLLRELIPDERRKRTGGPR